VNDHEAKLASYLHKRGLKFTRQRRIVMREVFASHEHFQADGLLQRMREKNLDVSKATLYRTLALLVEGGLLRQEVFGERHCHYEHIYGHKHHDHLLCLGCGKIEEFRNNDIERLQDQICRKYAFTPTTHQLEIHGHCKKCRKEQG